MKRDGESSIRFSAVVRRIHSLSPKTTNLSSFFFLFFFLPSSFFSRVSLLLFCWFFYFLYFFFLFRYFSLSPCTRNFTGNFTRRNRENARKQKQLTKLIRRGGKKTKKNENQNYSAGKRIFIQKEEKIRGFFFVRVCELLFREFFLGRRASRLTAISDRVSGHERELKLL